MKLARSPYFPGLLLLSVAIFLGILNYQDYGMGWDEIAQRNIGLVNYRYVFEGDRTGLDAFHDKDYGASFEVLLVAIEKIAKPAGFRDVFLMRHLVCHLYFLLAGCFCLYLLALRVFKNKWVAALGFLLLLQMPRFYAHSYFNSKDIVYAATCILCFLSLQVAFEKRKVLWYIIAGICCGYATSIRILGVLLPAATAMLLCVELCINLHKQRPLAPVPRLLLAYIASYVAATVLFWPYLWTAPLNNFATAYQGMAHFRWLGHVLFQGNFVHVLDLPASYCPVWFLYTVPVLWLLLGIAGILWVLVRFAKAPASYFTDPARRNFLLYLAIFFIPWALVVAMNSVIYDDWRHLYFIYPAFIMFALFSIHQLAKTRWRVPVVVLSAIQLGLTGIFMVGNHPFQQVYFNELMPRERDYVRFNYEMDYWGVSTKQALEYVLATDTNYHVKVSSQDSYTPVGFNVDFLPEDKKRRITLVSENDSTYNYFITFFRFHLDDVKGHTTVHDFRIHNSTFLRISKRTVK